MPTTPRESSTPIRYFIADIDEAGLYLRKVAANLAEFVRLARRNKWFVRDTTSGEAWLLHVAVDVPLSLEAAARRGGLTVTPSEGHPEYESLLAAEGARMETEGKEVAEEGELPAMDSSDSGSENEQQKPGSSSAPAVVDVEEEEKEAPRADDDDAPFTHIATNKDVFRLLETISNNLEAFKTQSKAEMQSGFSTLKSGQDQLKSELEKLKSGFSTLKSGQDQLKSGQDQLKSELEKLHNALSSTREAAITSQLRRSSSPRSKTSSGSLISAAAAPPLPATKANRNRLGESSLFT